MSDEIMDAKDYTFASDEMLESLQGDIALAAAGRGWARIGKLSLGLDRFIKWQNRQPTLIEFDEWKKIPLNKRGFDFVFDIDIKEFDKRAKEEGWDYIRRVTFKSRDWFDILVPSIEEIFGEGSMGPKNYMVTMSKLRDSYVNMLDVAQSPDKDGNIPTNSATGKPYTTVKLFAIFDSREKALVAYNELHDDEAASSDNVSGVDFSLTPQNWDEDNIEGVFKYIVKQLTTLPIKEAAKTSQVLGAKTRNGADVDTKSMLKLAVDNIPDGLLDLPDKDGNMVNNPATGKPFTKADLYEKVESYQ